MALTLAHTGPGTAELILEDVPTGIVIPFTEKDLPTMRRLGKLIALGQACEKYTEHFRAYSEATGTLKVVPEAALPQPVKDNLAEMVTFLDAVKVR